MGVWSSSPGRVGVVIAAERKSPSYKRHSRVTESVVVLADCKGDNCKTADR